VTAVPLTVSIASPSPQSNHFFPADSIVLIGHSNYLQGRSIPDADVSWSDSTTGAPLGKGHGPQFITAGTLCSNQPCHHTLVFTGRIANQTATASVDIFIDPTPVGAPPTVSIDAPANNASFPGQFIGCTPPRPIPGVIPLPVFSATINFQGHAIDQNGVAIPDSALIWRRNWVGGPVLGTGRSISANIVGTQANPTPGSPITFQIFITALDGMRNLGSASETITITTTVVPCP
jgi:hypothetical protein